jgi:3-isopropylmalate dehydratase small subunit
LPVSFYRNAVNIGLPILESAEAVDAIQEETRWKWSWSPAVIINLRTGTSYHSGTFSGIYAADHVDKGGLIEYVRDKIAK